MPAAPARCAIAAMLVFAGAAALYGQAPADDVKRPGDQESGATAASVLADSTHAVHEPGSGVRIVRLSQVRGQVQLDRDIDRGFEAAFVNMPITEHAQLRTAEGVAEIEFDDNSTLRLTPNTIVDFAQLRRTPSGATVSTVHIVQGLVYASLTNAKGNAFTLAYGQRVLVLNPAAHVELSVGAAESRLGVLDGTVHIEDPAGTTVASVTRKHWLFLDPASTAAPTAMAKMDKTLFDDWDKTATEYHKQYARSTAYGSSSAFYGVSDMNYYGSFVSLPGCGSVWRPYFASATWDPFANGVMAYYRGAGYSFVSPYPWGWTPYHSGSWQMCGAGGWGWQPGGSFVGLANAAIARRPTREPGQPSPVAPTRPSIVPISARPLNISRATSSDEFVFRQDSAGLGVPRQVFGKLNGISSTVRREGSYVAPSFSSAGLMATRTENQGHASAARGAGALSAGNPQPAASHSYASPAASSARSGGGSGAAPGGGGHH